MAIHSFLKAEKGDPDWQFTPEKYFGKEFKVVDASTLEMSTGHADLMVLRQNPTEKNLLAKHLKINVQTDAKLDLIVINEADSKLQQIFLYDVHVNEGSSINFGIFAKNGKLNKHIIQVHLDAGAEFNSYGLILNHCGGDTEVITKIIHQNPDTISNQYIVGMAGKDSQTVFQALTVLTPDSQGSEVHIEGNNLVLGENARCHTKPDIYVDCEATHSSSGYATNYLDQDKIYYLQSKGIGYKKAVETMINGFQNQVLSIIAYDDIRDEIKQIYSV